jgi:hypothetical protein
MANYTEWDKAMVTRAEQLVQLARYTAVDNLNTTQIDLQHAVIHNLFVHTELLQSLVYGQEGYNVPWDAASSYIRMNTELARLEGPPRVQQELELLLQKRREIIRDIILTLVNPVTKISVELDRSKLISLAHINKEIRPLIQNQQNSQSLQTRPNDILEQAMNLQVE